MPRFSVHGGCCSIRYQLTMHYVRKMLDKAIISQQEYEAIDSVMRQKYQPIFVTFMEQI